MDLKTLAKFFLSEVIANLQWSDLREHISLWLSDGSQNWHIQTKFDCYISQVLFVYSLYA
jgi:hypothetical protein